MNSTMPDDVFAKALEDIEAGDVSDTPEISLSQLQRKGAELRDADAEVARIEALLKEAKAKAERIATIELPNLMIEAKMKNFEMEDGFTAKLEKIYTGNIKEDNKVEAYAWLRSNKHSGIIKSKLVIDFGKGVKPDVLDKAVKKIEDLGFKVDLDSDVHWKTLRTFIKEMVEEENKNPVEDPEKQFPRNLFSVYIVDKVKLIEPKD